MQRIGFKNHGFTLIELLITVAIIAILASIAVYNFLEAQTRSKVARVQKDMRTVAEGVESFFVDHNLYPPAAAGDVVLAQPLGRLTSPIAYLTSIPPDLFSPAPLNFHSGIIMRGFQYKDRATTAVNLPEETYGPYWDDIPNHKYFVHSAGPNIVWDVVPFVFYDPTNGSISAGDLVRLGPG